jgi:hypothetical protein
VRFFLDEDATADQIAREGLWLPVLRPAPTQWLDLALVLDVGPSMRIWRHAMRELWQLLERQGAARDIRVWQLDTTRRGRVRIRGPASLVVYF